MKKLIAVSLMALASVVGVNDAFAKNDNKLEYNEKVVPMKDKIYAKMDANNDGAVSKEEFVKHQEEKFTRMDANADGKLVKEEMSWKKLRGPNEEGKPGMPEGKPGEHPQGAPEAHDEE